MYIYNSLLISVFKSKEGQMKTLRIFLLVVTLGAVGCLVSCKEETPADKLDDATQSLQKKAEKLEQEAADKIAE